MQKVQHLAALHIALQLLPQAFVGFIWSFICQALVSKIHGKIIIGIGAIAYIVGAALQIFVRQNTSYWMFLFPSLCITVIGADFQFIVSNVCLPSYTFTINS
jgi:nitrate/nitrite transporter NarK